MAQVDKSKSEKIMKKKSDGENGPEKKNSPQKSEKEAKASQEKKAPPPQGSPEIPGVSARSSSSNTSNAKREKRNDWSKTNAGNDDSLLACLEILSGLLGRSMSSAAFVSGLPLENNRMTPETFIRAAERAGISARTVKKKLSNISKLILPCVLLLDGNKACLLVSLSDKDNAEIVIPETGRGSTVLSIQDLEELYSGYAIFARPQYRYDTRSTDFDVERPRAWFWGTLLKFWPVYSKVAVAAVLINLFAIASPLFTMNVYDRVVPNDAVDTLIVLSIGIGIVFLFDFLLKNLRVYFVDMAGKNVDVLLASRIFEQVMGIKMAARPSSSGSFANQLREFETLREFFSSASFVALIDLPFIFLFITIVWIIGGSIAFVPLLAVPLVIIGSLLIHTPLSAWVKRSFREGAQKHALLVETINGLETVKSFGAEGDIQRNWEAFVSQAADSNKFLRFFAALAMNWSALIQQMSYVAVIIVGVFFISEGELSMGGLIACTILSARALAPLGQVVSLLTRFNQSKTALAALDKIIHLPVERPKGTNFLHRPVLKGEIEFNDVNFSYPGQKVSALKGFSLKVSEGEKVGVLGRIGSGKSTFEKLLLNLYAPESGTVKIDGTDTRQIDPADLRLNIGYVPQDIFLFFGTVRDNITFGHSNVRDSEIFQAAEVSGVLDFVRHHPQGFDMPVGEGGSCLSGGQRQAIAVARALIRNAPILVMDEPTAMMDNASEARLISRLSKFVESKTLVMITHRVPLLRLVSRLIVMDGGRVVADGPRDEVIQALSRSQIRSAN